MGWNVIGVAGISRINAHRSGFDGSDDHAF